MAVRAPTISSPGMRFCESALTGNMGFRIGTAILVCMYMYVLRVVYSSRVRRIRPVIGDCLVEVGMVCLVGHAGVALYLQASCQL